jgi:hypothetical protein
MQKELNDIRFVLTVIFSDDSGDVLTIRFYLTGSELDRGLWNIQTNQVLLTFPMMQEWNSLVKGNHKKKFFDNLEKISGTAGLRTVDQMAGSSGPSACPNTRIAPVKHVHFGLNYFAMFGYEKRERQQWHLIERLADANCQILRILECLVCAKPQAEARSLAARYYLVTAEGDILITSENTQTMAQTITVQPGQNHVPGQLIPLAADNVTVEPISTIQAGTEVYTSSDPSIATVAAVAGGAEGQFTVDRVTGKSGTISVAYTAQNTDGTTITNVGGVGDTFIFLGQATGLAQALTANYGAPTA